MSNHWEYMTGNFSRQGSRRNVLLCGFSIQLLWEYVAQYGQGEQPPSTCHSSCPTGLPKLMDSYTQLPLPDHALPFREVQWPPLKGAEVTVLYILPQLREYSPDGAWGQVGTDCFKMLLSSYVDGIWECLSSHQMSGAHIKARALFSPFYQ